MRRISFIVAFLCSTCVGVFAYPAPMPGSEDIRRLLAEAELVCKGEVVAAPSPVFRNDGAKFQATATVRMDLCYKGSVITAPVLFDGVQTGTGPDFILKTGDYDLFFLKRKNNLYERSDQWFSFLPVSKLTDQNSTATDPLLKLEKDLDAGLQDHDPELVYQSIELLGGMGHLSSDAELKQALIGADGLKKTYIWEALLKLKDYSEMSHIAAFFDSHPLQGRLPFLLPRDRVLAMESRMFNQISSVRDPAVLPYLEQFAQSPSDLLRMNAVAALRAIRSPESAAVLLKELDDPSPDTALQALHALIDIAGGPWPDWTPVGDQFRSARAMYVDKTRNWWRSEGAESTRQWCHCDPASSAMENR